MVRRWHSLVLTNKCTEPALLYFDALEVLWRPADVRCVVQLLEHLRADKCDCLPLYCKPTAPPEESECPCGHPFRGDHHLIYQCPQFHGARITTKPPFTGKPSLYNSRKLALRPLEFLQDPRRLQT